MRQPTQTPLGNAVERAWFKVVVRDCPVRTSEEEKEYHLAAKASNVGKQRDASLVDPGIPECERGMRNWAERITGERPWW